jgi:hypothetical protein
MKFNEIRITIKSSSESVFEFTLEPSNTHLWVEGVSKETIDTQQIGLGTIYSNKYGEMQVTDYDYEKFFELTNHETGYQRSYSYRKIFDDETELIYFENMQDGLNLVQPIQQKSFEKLKELLEK